MTEINASNLGGRAAFARARWLAPVAVMAVIFFFSSQPHDGHEMACWEVAARHLGHFAGYALLAGASVWAVAGRARRPLLLAAALSVAYAISDEYHQTFVEGRTGTAADVALDSAGIAAALLLIRRR